MNICEFMQHYDLGAPQFHPTGDSSTLMINTRRPERMWKSAPPKTCLTCIWLLQNHAQDDFLQGSSLFQKQFSGWIVALPLVQLKQWMHVTSCNHEILSWAAQFYMVWIHNTSSEYSMILCQGSHIGWAPCSSVKRYAHSCPGSKQFRRFQRTIQIGLPPTNSHWSLSPLGVSERSCDDGVPSIPVHKIHKRREAQKSVSQNRFFIDC